MGTNQDEVNRLRLARERAGLSVGQAARLLGIDRAELERIESPERQMVERAPQLAELYGVSVEWLLGSVPLRDYKRLAEVPGAENLYPSDRDELAMFMASLPTTPRTSAEALEACKAGRHSANVLPMVAAAARPLTEEAATKQAIEHASRASTDVAFTVYQDAGVIFVRSSDAPRPGASANVLCVVQRWDDTTVQLRYAGANSKFLKIEAQACR